MHRTGILTALIIFISIGCAENNRASKQIIATDEAPRAIGPYSQGVLVGNTLYCAGQIAIDPNTSQFMGGPAGEQAELALENLGAVLRAGGMTYSNVVKATVYLRDLNDYAEVNAVYAEFFPNAPPARAAVQVARLPLDAAVEISLIAVKE